MTFYGTNEEIDLMMSGECSLPACAGLLLVEGPCHMPTRVNLCNF